MKKIYEKFYTEAFVIDNNNFLKNNISNFIASEAISFRTNKNFDDRVFNENFFKTIHQKYAKHALGANDRKFIYIPYKKIFVPLYYDGNVNLLPGKSKCEITIKKKFLKDFKEEYKKLSKKNISKKQICVLNEILNIHKKNNMKLEDFFLEKKTTREESLKYSIIKNKIINYLNSNKIEQTVKNKKFTKKTFIYTFIYNQKYTKCYLDIEKNKINSCVIVDGKSYAKLISESGRSIKIDGFKSFPINLGSFNDELPIIKLDKNLNNFTLDKKATYHYINKSLNNSEINFQFKHKDSKLFIHGNFSDVDFNFNNDFKNDDSKDIESRYDKNLLTGCINFYDSSFENISIYSSDMKCEDSVNIKNSEGFINNINIENSLFDGLDLDFSKLNMKNVIINNSKNDCLDFSFGEYKISNASLADCEDKGISVGESSNFESLNINIINSNIAVASKDDSKTIIKNLESNKVNHCLAAYNKKKEFQGSRIEVSNFNCRNYKERRN